MVDVLDAHLRPVSRPEIARIRGANAESAVATLLERGLIEEAGRTELGGVLYRTTELFLRLFGSLDELSSGVRSTLAGAPDVGSNPVCTI